MPDYHFYVYILASRSRQLYIGVTKDLRRRIGEHRQAPPGSYVARYNIHLLVHVEEFQYILNAIAREKELKDWNRAKKLNLINQNNPTWRDLSGDYWTL